MADVYNEMTLPPQLNLNKLLKHLGAAVTYAWLLYAGDYLFEDSNFVGHFESASGLLLAVLLIGGYQYAWCIFLSAVLVHLSLDNSFAQSLVISSTDVLQALFGAWLITLSSTFDQRLLTLRSYIRLILLGGCASIAIGTLVVNTQFLYFGWSDSKDYLHNLLKWWMSDTLGVILIAPLILSWWWGRYNWRDAEWVTRLFLLLAQTVFACEIIFLDFASGTFIAELAQGYWMFIIVAWAAVYYGIGETILVLVLTAALAMQGAIWGTGYFAHDIVNSHLVNYRFYVLILSMVGMTLATYFAEQRRILADQRQFISMLTHELKTPISVVRMALDAMNMQGKLKHHADLAMHDMDDIIERCQQVDHIEHEQFKLCAQCCRMDEILSELTGTLALNRFFIKAESLPDLNTDPQLLRIILSNLISNAIKYSPPETVVDIHAEPAQHGNKPGIQMTIQNLPGDAGLPDPKHIFKKYYRSPGAHGKTGSGLGLYLARNITEMLGGKIVYEAAQEKVRFTLWIPC